ncbi:helix-turn-helix transcriptional regulator [Myceligenerans halotolerans]
MSESRDTPLDRGPMWTLDDLCRKLHCTRETVYTWRKHGIAPRAYKIGKHLLFEESDVRAWLEQHATDAVDLSSDLGSEPGDSSWGW